MPLSENDITSKSNGSGEAVAFSWLRNKHNFNNLLRPRTNTVDNQSQKVTEDNTFNGVRTAALKHERGTHSLWVTSCPDKMRQSRLSKQEKLSREVLFREGFHTKTALNTKTLNCCKFVDMR